MQTFVTWLSYLFALAALLHLPFQIARWRVASRLYGGIPISLVQQIWHYCTKNKALRVQTKTLLGMPLVPIAALLLHNLSFFSLEDLGIDSDTLRAVSIAGALFFLWQLERIAGYLLPPSVLLLGSSRTENIHLLGILNRRLIYHRVVSLHNWTERVHPTYVTHFANNNFRTVNDFEWRTIVHHLMDIVPLIIVDRENQTENIVAELRRIERRSFSSKTIAYSSGPSTPGYLDANFDMEIVLRSALHLSESLEPLILARLARTSDMVRRRNAQKEYTSMLRATPRSVRFTSEPNAMLRKAHSIFYWSMATFLRKCKGIPNPESAHQLIEDIPSIVPPDQELAFLQDSRGLEEVAILALGVLDSSKEGIGLYHTYNAASAHAKLGNLARFMKDFPRAVAELTKSIEILCSMQESNGATVQERQAVLSKLSGAYFQLGEAYMVIFRSSSNESAKIDAINCFQRSAKLDQELGLKVSDTTIRLQALR